MRLKKRTPAQQHAHAQRKKLLMQVLRVAVNDGDAGAIKALQQDNELTELTNWIKG